MNNKIEINILTYFLIEATILLFFFKESFTNLIIGLLLGIILIKLTNKNKKNKITNIILIILALALLTIILFKTTQFINYNILRNYSPIIIGISFFIISLNVVSKKYHTFIKTTEISSYLYLLLKTLSFILIIPLIINNFTINIIDTPNINYNSILIGLSILLIHKYIYYFTNYNITTKTIIISFINPIILKIISTIILGKTLFKMYNYPFVNYLKEIKYLDFIERIDGILSFQYIISFFIIFTFLFIFSANSCYRTWKF